MTEEIHAIPADRVAEPVQEILQNSTPQQDTQVISQPSEQVVHEPQTAQSASEAPEAQEIVWPEDVDVLPQAQEAFLQLARELELPSDTAQKLVDFEAGYIRAAQQARQAQEETWAEEIKQIYGPQWEEEVSRAVRAADVFGGPQLRALLEESGLGNHPVIVRTFNRIGKRISEDNTPLGQTAATGDKTFAEAMYGTLK